MRDLIKKILKESEDDDFGWTEDILNTEIPNIFELKNGDDGLILFYFFPYITGNEYVRYVEPTLIINNILNKYKPRPDAKIDHLEIHPIGRYRSLTQNEALYGGLDYFDCETVECFIDELSDNGGLPHDGRKYFNIP